MRTPMRPLAALLALGCLAACSGGADDADSGSNGSSGGGSSGGSSSSGSGSGGGGTPGLQMLADQGCNWVKVFDPDVDNLAFPDTSANYWLALIPNPGPAAEVWLRGRVPAVRYFAYNSYDAGASPYDAIADYLIAPDAGGTTPFLGPVTVDRSHPVGSSYQVSLRFEPIPDGPRAPNTLYSNRLLRLADQDLSNPALALVIYRTYLPEGDVTGGAGLPEIRVAAASGDSVLLGSGSRCSELVKQLTSTAGLSQLTGPLNDYGQPPIPSAAPAPPGSTSPPTFNVFYGVVAGLQTAGVPVPEPLAQSSVGGFFSTKSSRYVFAFLSRNFGDLVLVRARAPRHVDGQSWPTQLRYWSMCQNEFFTQRVFGCVPDREARVDRDGWFNIVVSDGLDRPSAADPAHGFNWLPWGPFYDAELIYRHMLPAEDFAQAFQNVPRGTDPREISGDYLPVATYCDRAVFDAAAASGTPSEVFEACRQAQENPV